MIEDNKELLGERIGKMSKLEREKQEKERTFQYIEENKSKHIMFKKMEEVICRDPSGF